MIDLSDAVEFAVAFIIGQVALAVVVGVLGFDDVSEMTRSISRSVQNK